MQALRLNLNFLKGYENSPYKINWSKTIAAVNKPEEFAETADKIIKTPEGAKNYALLRTVAALYEKVKPEYAVHILGLAKPLLPIKDTAQVTSFYRALVPLLIQTEKMIEAALAQKELISITKQGAADLALLYYRNQDTLELSAVIRSLSLNSANENEVLSTALAFNALFESGREDNKEAQTISEQILTHYLKVERIRDPLIELQARSILADVLIQQQRLLEAQTVIDAPVIDALLAKVGEDTPLAASVRQLRNSLKVSLQ